jgi:hypothetical protein
LERGGDLQQAEQRIGTTQDRRQELPYLRSSAGMGDLISEAAQMPDAALANCDAVAPVTLALIIIRLNQSTSLSDGSSYKRTDWPCCARAPRRWNWIGRRDGAALVEIETL